MRKLFLCVAAILAVCATSATAASLITSSQIKDGTIQNRDIKEGTVSLNRLSDGTQNLIRSGSSQSTQASSSQPGAKGDAGATGATGAQGAKGDQGERGSQGSNGSNGTNGTDGHDGVSGLESDGPYPGATNLQEGDNSTAYWTKAAGLNQSWVSCPAGKVATGGGFTLASDASDADKKATQVVTSQPAQIENGQLTYSPIEGDADGSFVPNAWLVEGYYDGDNTALVVRPHVICAAVGEED